MKAPTLTQIAEFVIDELNSNNNCRKKCDCNAPLTEARLEFEPHDGGRLVSCSSRGEEKLWIYLHCQKCGYDWALWKLQMNIKKLWGDAV